MSDYTRTGRAADSLRNIKMTPNFLPHADGSCLIECGNTKVICTASIDENVPPFLRGKEQGWVTAEYGMLPASTASRMRREAAAGKQSGRTQEIQRLIGRSLRAVVDMEKLGERQILIDCDVIQADGGTRTASITGAYVALQIAVDKLLSDGLIQLLGRLKHQLTSPPKGCCVDFKEFPNNPYPRTTTMSIKSDKWIRRMAEEHGMIEPFEPNQIKEANGQRIISYGTSSYGYDIRCANEFKIFTNINSTIVDPKNFDPKNFVTVEDDCCIIPPNSFALARTVEYFRIPRNVLTVCLGKSTYARCGIIVNVTPFEPEWEGYVTLEFSNTTPLPAKIYAGEGVAQVLFFESDEVCETSYKDRNGKYMGQTGVTLPKT